MKQHIFDVWLILAGLSGCGTFYNLAEERKPYGGLASDVHFAMHGAGLVEDIIGQPLAAIDAPFSAVGDTITLPITLYSTANRWLEAKRAEEADEWYKHRHVPASPPQHPAEPKF